MDFLRSTRRLIPLWVLILASCGLLPLQGPPASAPPTDTIAPPTPTIIPYAAKIDGEIISQDAYQAELKRYESAQTSAGIDLATMGDYQSAVLEEMIDLRLLVRGAQTQGLTIDGADVERRIAEIEIELGGPELMDAWLSEYFYSYETFREALMEELLAMNMVNWIAENVPLEAEQVHARHILVATREDAESLLIQLEGGADFDTLADQYSLDASTRLAGGDLGWFPHGALLQPEVEEAAFATEPGEVSEVIESELGFHVIEVLARAERKLGFQDRLAFQERAVQDWLEIARTSAVIERNFDH